MMEMIRIITAIVVASLLLAGCNRPQASTAPDLGGPSGTISWSATAETEKPLAGIDQASICYAGTAFVVWSAFDGGGSSGQTSSVSGVKGQGRLWSLADGDVEFRFATEDGKSGTATINEAQYNLEDGGLFLVAANDGQVQVKQLKRDLRDVKFDREGLAAFARNDAEIVAFFARKE
jgi:hypothetical protein